MKNNSEDFYGNIYAVSSFILWGFLTVYWKALEGVPALQLVFHRIVWCFVLMSALTVIRGRTPELLKILTVRRNVIFTALAGFLVSINWFTYVLAVSSGRVLQASMGYYINPLMSILLGLVFLREKLPLRQKVSLLLACTGVAVITIGSGIFPWISVSLAVTFSVYGFIKKTVSIPTDLALMLETMFVTPAAAAGMIFFRSINGPLLGSLPPVKTLLLLSTGFVTALPLFLFAEGTRRIPLSRVGFLQFISPSIMFLIGVLMYNEALTPIKITSFLFIWTALVLFLLPSRRYTRKDTLG